MGKARMLILMAAVLAAVVPQGATAQPAAWASTAEIAHIEVNLAGMRAPGYALITVGSSARRGVSLAGEDATTGDEHAGLEMVNEMGELSAEAARALLPAVQSGQRFSIEFDADYTSGPCRSGRAQVRVDLLAGSPETGHTARPDAGQTSLVGKGRVLHSLRVLGGMIDTCLGSSEITGGEGTLMRVAGAKAGHPPDPIEPPAESPPTRSAAAQQVTLEPPAVSLKVVETPWGAYSPGFEGTAPQGVLPKGLSSSAIPTNSEIVWGTDDRIQVTNTTYYPSRAVGRITGTWHGTNKTYACTGFLIGPDTVMTAGHCVYNFEDYKTWGTSVSFSPGQNGESKPYGTCGTTGTLKSRSGWVNNGDYDYDIGIIKLNCSIGNTVGWFGFFYTSSDLEGLPTYIRGYPSDKAWGTMWRSTGYVIDDYTHTIHYKNDTYKGMSGSPVYYNRSGCGKCAYGPHSGSNNAANRGTRLTSTLFNWAKFWKNA